MTEAVINQLAIATHTGSDEDGDGQSSDLPPLHNGHQLLRPRSSTVGEVFVLKSSDHSSISPSPTRICNGSAASVFRVAEGENFSVTERRLSLRQAIFSRVVYPKSSRFCKQNSLTERSDRRRDSCQSPTDMFSLYIRPISPFNDARSSVSSGETVLSSEYYKTLWKKAVFQQMLLIRMDRGLPKDDTSDLVKLEYDEIASSSTEPTAPMWQKLLTVNGNNNQPTKDELTKAVQTGIPKQLRGKVWRFLLQQRNHNEVVSNANDPIPEYCYDDLLTKLASHQHAILVDLGRTFPTHPYFQQQFGPGQLALFNILKAYSLLDSEVGYCQGLSFIAGILLIHLEEKEAFDVLVQLMYTMGVRNQYKPDMTALQVEMYQLQRLLHAYHEDLYWHFENFEIPSLYAAPWFLTLFASTFPLGFVARVFDFIFLHGSFNIIFKVALVLLGNHKELIKHCDSFEEINDFLKTTLPSMSFIQTERVFNQVSEMDLSQELLTYNVEYRVIQEEIVPSTFLSLNSISFGSDLNTAGIQADLVQQLANSHRSLKLENSDLLAQVDQLKTELTASDAARLELETKLQSSDNTIASLRLRIANLETSTKALEIERKGLLNELRRLNSN